MRTPCNTPWIATLIVFRLHHSFGALYIPRLPCFVQYLLFIMFTSAIRLDRLNPVLPSWILMTFSMVTSLLIGSVLHHGHVLVVQLGSRRCPFRSLFYLNLVLFVLIIPTPMHPSWSRLLILITSLRRLPLVIIRDLQRSSWMMNAIIQHKLIDSHRQFFPLITNNGLDISTSRLRCHCRSSGNLRAVYSLTLLLVNERHYLHFAIDQRISSSFPLFLFTSTPNNRLN